MKWEKRGDTTSDNERLRHLLLDTCDLVLCAHNRHAHRQGSCRICGPVRQERLQHYREIDSGNWITRTVLDEADLPEVPYDRLWDELLTKGCDVFVEVPEPEPPAARSRWRIFSRTP